MRIVFDKDFNTGFWPGPLGKSDASIGELWVGEDGFRDALEMAVGLGGHYPSPMERALGLVGVLEKNDGFWSKSTEVDPIGSAQRILSIRDDLWMHGWRWQGQSKRLKQLAAVCRGINHGLPDRLAAIADALGSRSAGIDRVDIFEDLQELPAAWIDVIKRLEAQGARIVRHKLDPVEAAGDLAASRKNGFTPKRDGSLQLLRPPGFLEAAEETAAFLSKLEESESTVVVCPDETLDQALHRHGRPTIGKRPETGTSPLSPILPLVLSLGWSPQDPTLAAELLALSNGPVPRRLSRKLMRALREWPAVGSDDWKEVLAGIDDKEYKSNVRERLRVFFKPVVERGSLYPQSEVTKRLDVLRKWLHGRMEGEEKNKEPWNSAIDQCDELGRLVIAYGRSGLSNRELLLLVEKAGEVGKAPRSWPAEAGIRGLGSPGGVAGEVENVVWWNFSLSKYSPPSKIPLSKGEEKELSSLGVRLPDPGREAVRQAERWRRPLLQASRSVLLVCPQRGTDGEENFPHPAWDEVKSRLLEWQMEKELVDTRIFGRKMPGKKRSELLPLPGQITKLGAGKGKLKLRGTESPSSLGPMIGCPLQYVLKYTGKLEAGISAGLPDASDSRVRGSLAHQLLAEVLGHESISPDEARETAGSLFDRKAPRLMTVLFLPGNDAARAEVRRVICQAAENLVRLLGRMGLTVRETEKEHKDKALGITVSGKLDLLAGDPKKVIDLKWSGAGYRAAELEAGAAYQLATYSRLISEKFPPVAYYIIRDNRLLATDKRAFPEAEEVRGPGPAETWAALERAFLEIRRSLEEGEFSSGVGYEPPRKTGFDPGAIKDGVLVLPPQCYFCDFVALCGVEL